MKAVNLLPGDARHGGVGSAVGRLGIGHLLVALLLVGLCFVTLDVLTGNTISSRKAQLSNLQQEATQMQAEITRLNTYTKFEKLASDREETVRQIASTRFDWYTALSNLAKVMPADTTLQSLIGTVSPSTSAPGGGSGGSSNVRGDIDAPAFQLTGCTGSQDDVAGLISQLRLINGVTRVTLESSANSTTGSGSSATTGCPANGPTFNLTVFFQPLPSTTTSTTTTSTTTTAATSTPAPASP
jgi:Tfp pilus assembly protein PilN